MFLHSRPLLVVLAVSVIVPGWGWGRRPRLVEEKVAMEIQAGTEARVRLKNPPPQFDEKGKPKKYTRAELAALKGDGHLPGYQGSFGDLKKGQIVEVYLSRQKVNKDNGKTTWTFVGKITGELGQIEILNGSTPRKRPKTEKDRKRESGAAALLTVHVERLARNVGLPKKEPHEDLGDKVFATRIIVLHEPKSSNEERSARQAN